MIIPEAHGFSLYQAHFLGRRRYSVAMSSYKITMQPTQAISNFLVARLKQYEVSFNNLFYLADYIPNISISICSQNYTSEGSGDGSLSTVLAPQA